MPHRDAAVVHRSIKARTPMNNQHHRHRIGPCIAGIATALFLASNLPGCGKNDIQYRTEPVTRGDMRQTVTATGTVNPVTTVQVGTQVSGTIKSLFADFNSRVKKGQIIAQIDPSTFEAQVQQADANLHAAQANL